MDRQNITRGGSGFHRGHRGDRGGGGRGGRGGVGRRGGSGGGGPGGSGNAHHSGPRDRDRDDKDKNIIDLSKYLNRRVIVKFTGGREVTGTLKGFDALMNLVLDETQESMRDDKDERDDKDDNDKDDKDNNDKDDKDDNNDKDDKDKDNDNKTKHSRPTRDLGLAVVRGPLLAHISPEDGTEEIANPFLASSDPPVLNME